MFATLHASMRNDLMLLCINIHWIYMHLLDQKEYAFMLGKALESGTVVPSCTTKVVICANLLLLIHLAQSGML